MKFGYIPKELTLFIQPEKSVFLEWNTPILGKRAENERVEYKARPVFVCDTDNPQALSRARKNCGKDCQEITILNICFFSKLTIVSSEILKDKHRKYHKYFKGIIDIGELKNLFITIREDVFLENLYISGADRNVCFGSFIFSKINSRMELLRENSFLHQLSIESTELKKMSVKRDLEIGGIYANNKGEQYLYLGKYWSTDVKYSSRKIRYDYNEDTGSYEYSWRIEIFDEQSLYFVFYRVYPPIELPIVFDLNYNFHIVKNHSFRVKRDKLIPEDNDNFNLSKMIINMPKERKLHFPLIANLRQQKDSYIDDFFLNNTSGERVVLD